MRRFLIGPNAARFCALKKRSNRRGTGAPGHIMKVFVEVRFDVFLRKSEKRHWSRLWLKKDTWSFPLCGHLVDKSFTNLGFTRTGEEYSSSNSLTWIGLHQANYPADTTWTWTDGTAVDYLNWAPTQPSNSDGKEHCVEVRKQVVNCDDKQLFLISSRRFGLGAHSSWKIQCAAEYYRAIRDIVTNLSQLIIFRSIAITWERIPPRITASRNGTTTSVPKRLELLSAKRLLCTEWDHRVE